MPMEKQSITEVPAGAGEGKEKSKEPEDWRPVTMEEGVRVLSRLPLSPDIMKVLRHLYKADKPLSSKALKKELGHNASQWRGVMGAFHRRVRGTVDKNVYFLEQQWRGDEYYWSLPDNAKRAMVKLKLV